MPYSAPKTRIAASTFALLIILLATVIGKPLYADGQTDTNQQSLDALLATADVKAGEQVSHQCTMCHTFTKGGSDGIGPNLWNIVGSFRAHSPNYNYSDALNSMHHEKWTYDALNFYIANPHKFAPGDKMPFAGIAGEKKRADLIAWLRTLSDKPVPLPAAR